MRKNSKQINPNELKSYKFKNDILEVNHIYDLHWIRFTHKIIHNSYNQPEYFKRLLKLTKNRNGLLIQTSYRKSKFGDNISHNIMQEKWNELKIETRNLQELNSFIVEYLKSKK